MTPCNRLTFAGSTITNTPPGFSTLRVSASPDRLSNQSLNENREHTASKVESSKGNSSAFPSINSTADSPLSSLLAPTLPLATLSISGIGSRQTSSAPSKSSAKLPGPQPISRTLPLEGRRSLTILRQRETWPRVANRFTLS